MGKFHSNNNVLLVPKFVYKIGVILFLLSCILFTYKYNRCGYKKKTGPLWYGPSNFYSDESEIEKVKHEHMSFDHSKTSSLKLKGSKTARRISLDSVIKLVPPYEESFTHEYEYKQDTFSGTSDKRLNTINESSKPKAKVDKSEAYNYNDSTVNNYMPSDDNKERFNMKLKESKKRRYNYYSGNSLIKMVLPSEDNKSFLDSKHKQKILSETANPKSEALKVGRDRYDKKNSLIKMVLSSVEKENSNITPGNSEHTENKINEFSAIRPYADIKLSHLKDSMQTHILSNTSLNNHMLFYKQKKLSNLKLKEGRHESDIGNNLLDMVLPSEYSKTSTKDSKQKQTLLNNISDLQINASEKGREGSIADRSLIKMVLPVEYNRAEDKALRDSMHKQKLSSEIPYLKLNGSEKGRGNKTLIKMMLPSVENVILDLKLKDSKESFSKISVLRHSPLEAVANVTSFQSSHCRLRNVKLFKSPLPLIGLLSFPGSGNTWTRHLIQQMTGIGTSSVYCDSSLLAKGFPYECIRNRGKTIVVKTHHTKHLPTFKKVVLLVRNPYDAFVAFANFNKAGHTGRINRTKLIKVIHESFKTNLVWFTSLIRNTTEQFKGPVHVLEYEKLKTDMKTELRRLAIFLNTEVTDRDIDCAYKNQEGHYHRHISAADRLILLRTVYDTDQLLQLREATRTAEKLIKEAYNIDINLGGSVEDVMFQ